MIIRKPYAFLIKNFRKIHIFLLALCFYIFYVDISTRSFIKDFITLGTYDSYLEPITSHIGFLAIISLIFVIVISGLMMIVLKRKNKPWKLYLLPILEYLMMFILFIIIINFFNNYKGVMDSTTGIRAISDLLFMVSIFQYPVFLIFVIRILGLDLAKFSFKSDKEFLELEEDDREEVEISIDIDKESIKRAYKKLKRNIGYVYTEHKFIINIIFTIIIIFSLWYSYNYFFIIHKVYKEGEVLNANNYSIKINDVYLTNKDKAGKVIENRKNFVIVNLTIKNNGATRNVDFSKFHIINGISNYYFTSNMYQNEFKDLGKTYSTYELKNGKELNLILVYKVSNKLNKDRFVLYYQEINGYNKTYLRKIKVKINDLTAINSNNEINISEQINIKDNNTNKKFTIESFDIVDSTSYLAQKCSSNNCSVVSNNLVADPGYKILKIDYISTYFNLEDLIDFFSQYGIINYDNSSGKSVSVSTKNYIPKGYLGNYLYLKVPEDVANSSSIKIIFTIRNNKYIYKLR